MASANGEYEPYMSSGQAASLLHVAKGTLLRAVRLGEVPVARRLPGGGLQFRRADIEAFARSLASDRPAQADDPAVSRLPLHGEPLARPEHAVPVRRSADDSIAVLGELSRAPRQALAEPRFSFDGRLDDAGGVVEDILALLADTLHVGATFVARSTDQGWRVEQLCDRVGMGITAQAALPLADHFGEPLRTGSMQAFSVDDARSDARFPALDGGTGTGIGSYTGAAIRHADGTLYGVICTLHPRARQVGESETTLLQLAGRIVLQALDADALRERERAFRHDLEASQEQLRRIYGAMACGVIAFNADGSVLDVNEAALTIMGTDRETVVQRGIAGLRDLATSTEGVALARARVPLLAPDSQEGRRWSGREVLFSRPDGERRSVQVDTVALFDADGRLQQAVASFVDITEHRRADQQLQESRERFRALLENALDLISIVDREGHYRYASPSYKTLLGYDPELLVGTPLFDSLLEADAARFRQAWPALIAGAGTKRGTLRVRDAGGSLVDLDGYMRVALDNPAIAGISFNGRALGAADSPSAL